MSARTAFGIVAIAAADLRRQPRHASELRSQLLLGEAVRIDAARDGGQWLRVTGLEDGYSGWLRSWALVRVSAERLARWRGRARARLAKPMETLRSEGARRHPLMPVFFGSRVEIVRVAGGRAVVRLPDGRRGSVPIGSLLGGATAPISLKRRISTLMGVPYLWGGRTPAGFDCSGFTQMVLAEQGIALPRDAREQFRATRRLGSSERAEAGDLIYFARAGESVSHVGIMLSPGTFVHCRGTVHETSVDPMNTLCEKELLAQFRGFGRPEMSGAGRPIRARLGAKSA